MSYMIEYIQEVFVTNIDEYKEFDQSAEQVYSMLLDLIHQMYVVFSVVVHFVLLNCKDFQ